MARQKIKHKRARQKTKFKRARQKIIKRIKFKRARQKITSRRLQTLPTPTCALDPCLQIRICTLVTVSI